MKTLVYSTHGFDKAFLEKAAKDKHEMTFSELPLNVTSTNLAKGFEAVALFTADKADEETLELLHKNGIRYIALRSVGYDHVHLKKAKQLELKVANVPNYSPYASAEHAVTLLLALNRKITVGQELMDKNDFRLDKLVGFDVHGKTIGIIGTGAIGTAFATIMQGFGCQLIGYDILENKALIDQTNIRYTSFEQLCQLSDVISIHCPLNDATNYLLDKKAFQQMKKGVIIINTARGGIINTLDLIEALDNNKIAAVGLDVYENEKGIFFNDLSHSKIKDDIFEKLRSHPNVLLTGHQAFLTKEALQGIAETTISNLSEWTQNGISKNDLW